MKYDLYSGRQFRKIRKTRKTYEVPWQYPIYDKLPRIVQQAIQNIFRVHLVKDLHDDRAEAIKNRRGSLDGLGDCMDPQSQSRFFRLPIELRLQIYELVLGEPGHIHMDFLARFCDPVRFVGNLVYLDYQGTSCSYLEDIRSTTMLEKNCERRVDLLSPLLTCKLMYGASHFTISLSGRLIY